MVLPTAATLGCGVHAVESKKAKEDPSVLENALGAEEATNTLSGLGWGECVVQ